MTRHSSSSRHSRRHSSGSESLTSSSAARSSTRTNTHSRKYSTSGLNTSINEVLDEGTGSKRPGSAYTKYQNTFSSGGHAHEGLAKNKSDFLSSGTTHLGQEEASVSNTNTLSGSSKARLAEFTEKRTQSTEPANDSQTNSLAPVPQLSSIAPLQPLSPIPLPRFDSAPQTEPDAVVQSSSTSHIPAQGRSLGLYGSFAHPVSVGRPSTKGTSVTKLKMDNPNAYVIRADVPSVTAESDQREPRQPEMVETGRGYERSPRRNMHRNDGSSRQRSQNRTSDPSKKSKRDKDNKTLAKALKRANDAVILDTAQQYRKAVDAYEESCDLLLQVINRGTEKERLKLKGIREAYIDRIEELQIYKINDQGDESNQSSSQPVQLQHSPSNSLDPEDPQQSQASAHPLNSHISNHDHLSSEPSWRTGEPGRSIGSASGPLPQATNSAASTSSLNDFDPEEIASLVQEENEMMASLVTPMDEEFMPRPLSPFRQNETPSESPLEDQPEPVRSEVKADSNRRRDSEVSNGSAVWPNNAGSTGSSRSSMHSTSSNTGLHRKHIRVGSGDTEAEFDAALDAAVEAAYGDGYDVYRDESDAQTEKETLSRTTTAQTDAPSVDVPLDREAIISAAKARETERRRNQQPRQLHEFDFGGPGDSDEDERLLEEPSPNLEQETSSRSAQTRALPRQSDSSNSSGRTWGSSIASSLNTAGTSLTTVDEHTTAHSKQGPPKMPPPAPPPTTALPPTPVQKASPSQSPETAVLKKPIFPAAGQAASVQDRRGSGQRAKKLKIETSVGSKLEQVETAPEPAKRRHLAAPPNTATGGTFAADSRLAANDIADQTGMSPIKARFISSPFPSPFVQAQSPPTPGLSTGLSFESSGKPSPLSASSGVPASRLHLRPDGQQSKPLLSPASAEFPDASPGTPMTFTFSSLSPGQRVPANTPVVGAFAQQARPSTNVSLFENDIHSMASPSMPESRSTRMPRPLESCPQSMLLRPFWLMRCIYQTLAHPKGGYLSTKLFIPREVWQAKNVKLKNVEDKIANCDLLTAALLKLSAVDTLDADAVLEEMQSLENVLDQAQASLTKKLGSEVGVQHVTTFFKDAPPSVNAKPTSADADGGQDTSSKSSSKSYLSSWRKLRTKNSGANLAGQLGSRDGSKENLTMSTVPMTTSLSKSARSYKHGLGGGADIKAEGPNAQYMSCLARLCESAQVLDQIARQVEDPGLKHSSATHVGLELSMRHAAEFFAFYICRFILQDVTMLAEKFVKRASEWVLV